MKPIIISAPSGAGKTTLVNRLMKQIPELTFSISSTTRSARKGEKHAKEYYFIDQKEFKNKIVFEDFIEWEEVYNGVFYGTLKSELDRAEQANKSLLFDVDVLGGISLKEYFGEESLAIFISVTSLNELKIRLEKRNTENSDEIVNRISRAEFEMGQKNKFDVIIVNDILEEAEKKLVDTVKAFLKS